MSDSPSDPKSARHRPLRNRRAPQGKPGSVRWLKSLLGRPLKLERRGLGLRMTLVDRRRSAEDLQADSLAQLREELRLRMLKQEHQHAAAVMRHLVFVRHVLGRQGWLGVQAVESRVLARALAQAQMLAQRESSRRLAQFVDRMRMFQAAAEAREERLARSGAMVVDPDVGPVEVSEVSVEEFEASQLEWNATRAADL